MSTIGIFWVANNRVPPDEAKLLRQSLASYIRQGLRVKDLPGNIGAFDLESGTGKTRKLYLCMALDPAWPHVGWLVDDPDPNSGVPKDGPPISQLDYVEEPKGKPQRSEREHPGFGWDPGYGED